MDKTMNILTIGVFVCLVLIIQGCIENRYTYKFNLDGSCNFTGQLRGDSADVYTPPGSYPQPPVYQVRTWTEYDSAGRAAHVLEAKAHFPHDSIPATLGSLEASQSQYLIHHPVQLSVMNLFLLRIFNFEQVFQGRQSETWEGDRWKYIPSECKVLETGGDSLLSAAERTILEEKYAAGMLLWNAERYNLRFREILKSVLASQREIKLNTQDQQILLARLDSLVNAHSRREQALLPSGNLDMVNLEWWGALVPQANVLLEQYLNPSGSADLQKELLQIEELLEFRHQVDEDVADETFTVNVDLPGRVMRSNTTIMEKGVLVWKILGQDLQENDVVLYASSIYLHPLNIVSFITALVILIFYIRARGLRRHRHPMTGPPPPPRK